MTLKEEIIKKVNDLIYYGVMDDEFCEAPKTKQKAIMIDIINKYMKEVDTGLVSADKLIKDELISLIGKISNDKYILSINWGGYSPVLNKVVFE